VPERLYAYLDTLWERRDLDGAIVEIGCFRGGTTRIAFQFLQRTGHEKRYVCVDTFGGFTTEQLERDLRRGVSKRWRAGFSANSRILFERLMRHYGCSVEIVEADVATMAGAVLPGAIAVCLLDVDLEVPTYEGLRRVWPRLAPGGAILVDDCSECDNPFPGARSGYRRFLKEEHLEERYLMGMGVVLRG
jgi:hypothetical protein